MPTAVIVEDEPLLRAELTDQLRALWPELEIAGHAENGIDAVACIDAVQPDIVFLDIQMPGLNGLEVARHIPDACQVVFVTAYADHALAAFDAGACDYLVKPPTTARLLQAIRRLKSRAAASPPPAVWDKLFERERAPVYLKWIKASSGTMVRLVMVSEVLYFAASEKYTRVVTEQGDALIRLPLKTLLEQLDPQQFTQIHRSAIVNLQAIDRIEREQAGGGSGLVVILKGRAERLAVSEAFTRQFRQM
ncbi:LytR/AlgR family response regulator transcription factor [Pseudoduganella chitinolytica]|uniref:LytTR family DNA-binding domain-containing protein n=1 Tax=Pseudoduganella chitinolytica TaxID=34070 RepID=A0ABY8BG36_9BURK|nr:LytTR family DNA-binding domain-containing protein [Pseudoduganella chitinolytica]WEF33682.1 LytTR family DNA-binding domain-containing protein [Pseudoduganella chitinolytica]